MGVSKQCTRLGAKSAGVLIKEGKESEECVRSLLVARIRIDVATTAVTALPMSLRGRKRRRHRLGLVVVAGRRERAAPTRTCRRRSTVAACACN